MMLLAKAALGVSGALVLAGAYTFREGVIRVDVDEYRDGGSHVHMWLPAAATPRGPTKPDPKVVTPVPSRLASMTVRACQSAQ